MDTKVPELVSCVVPATVSSGVDCTALMPDLRPQMIVADTCTITISQVPAPGTVLTAGITEVTLVATDASGNSTNCTTTVSVIDTTAPVIDCPANITVACSDTNGAVVNYTVGVVDNCDANPIVTAMPASGSMFAVGTNFVAVTAVDTAGNTNTCSFMVIVQDPVQPTLTITHVGADVVITWPQTCTTYVLEEALEFAATTTWMPVTGAVQAIGADYKFTVTASAGDKFYRLKKQP